MVHNLNGSLSKTTCTLSADGLQQETQNQQILNINVMKVSELTAVSSAVISRCRAPIPGRGRGSESLEKTSRNVFELLIVLCY